MQTHTCGVRGQLLALSFHHVDPRNQFTWLGFTANTFTQCVISLAPAQDFEGFSLFVFLLSSPLPPTQSHYMTQASLTKNGSASASQRWNYTTQPSAGELLAVHKLKQRYASGQWAETLGTVVNRMSSSSPSP